MENRARRLLALLSILLASAALAEPSRQIDLEFKGTLREALKKIAAEGRINLIITGDLAEPAEVVLHDASPEEALETVAKAYHLRVTQQGNMWTLRPMTEEEKKAASATPAAAPDAQAEADGSALPSMPALPSLPALPTLPALPNAPTPPAPPELSELQQRIKDRIEDKLARKLERKLHRGRTHGNDLVGTGPLSVEKDQRVDSVVSLGGPVTVSGRVDKDVVALGGPVELKENAVVEGDVVSLGGPVTLGENTLVEGEVVAFGGPINRAESAEVQGGVVAMGGAGAGRAIAALARHAHEDDGEHDGERGGWRINGNRASTLSGFLLRFAVLFGVGFLCMMFMPARMKVLEAELRRDPIKSGLTGLVGAIALVPMTALLAVTIVGIPFAVALVLLAIFGGTMGLCAVANEIGTRLPLSNVRKTQAVVLAAGLLILLVLGLIPVLGPMALTVLGLLSLGAIIRTRFGSRKQGVPEPV